MELNNPIEIKDGDVTLPCAAETPSSGDNSKQKVEENAKKKRRRGKSKRKIMKPFSKIPWQNKRNDKTKRNNRFRKLVLSKTNAPYNNNQFLMEIHKPEPENNFPIMQTPSARTRDSSFSVDSEENYFYSLPEDEEEFLTKEFSSVYEDAQCERLSDMSKNDLIQEYLILEAKYENLVKRTERNKWKIPEEGKEQPTETASIDESSFKEMNRHLKEQEDQIRELRLANENLILENERLRQRSCCSSSEDSESDSSSTSVSCSSSSSRSRSPGPTSPPPNDVLPLVYANGMIPNGSEVELQVNHLVNGFHNDEPASNSIANDDGN